MNKSVQSALFVCPSVRFGSANRLEIVHDKNILVIPAEIICTHLFVRSFRVCVCVRVC